MWLRRDLRLDDNTALLSALDAHKNVSCVFNFDPYFLTPLPKKDRRLTVIIEALADLNARLKEKGSALILTIGDPKEQLPRLIRHLSVTDLYFNRDYTPYALKRDALLEEACKDMGVLTHSYKDHVLCEPHEIEKPSGGFYTVFTPYKKRWLYHFDEVKDSLFHQPKPLWAHLMSKERLEEKRSKQSDVPLFEEVDCYDTLGFDKQNLVITPTRKAGLKRLTEFGESGLGSYQERRDFPAIEGTSGLSVHIRYGLISIRDCYRMLCSNAQLGTEKSSATVWLSELVWREFYQMILACFPQVQTRAFREQYDQIHWLGNPEHFERWRDGETGFPIIDAAMRAFKQTGLMHNRLRMVVASFLCKTLLLDWRLGESYFAQELLDFELASNNGGWQWAASSGCDAQPYFRIFNPHMQAKKFDPDAVFIHQFCPELAGFSAKACWDTQFASLAEQKESGTILGKDYPKPIVSYKDNRALALEMYKRCQS